MAQLLKKAAIEGDGGLEGDQLLFAVAEDVELNFVRTTLEPTFTFSRLHWSMFPSQLSDFVYHI